jgi:hypothetical protein
MDIRLRRDSDYPWGAADLGRGIRCYGRRRGLLPPGCAAGQLAGLAPRHHESDTAVRRRSDHQVGQQAGALGRGGSRRRIISLVTSPCIASVVAQEMGVEPAGRLTRGSAYRHTFNLGARPRDRPNVLICRIAGVAVGGRGNVRVSDARLVEGRWVGLAFVTRSPAGSTRTAAVMRDSPGELGEELGVGVGLAEAVEEHVDGLLAVPAVEGPAQGAGGCHFLGGQQ